MPSAAGVATALARRTAAVGQALQARTAEQQRRRQEDEDRRKRRRRWILAGIGILILMIAAPMGAIIIAVGGTRDPNQFGGVSGVAVADIPPEALTAYRDAGAAWRIDWAILAAVGKVECDHGRTPLRGCNPPSTMNGAGARGYLQFIGSTWRRGLGQFEMEPRTSPPAGQGQGYATDGDGDGDADPWSWPDATHSAARYLVALGVAQDAPRAIFGYNHSQAYVDQVMSIAETYRQSAAAGTGTFEGAPGNVPLTTVEGITVHTQIAGQVQALVQAARADGLNYTGGGYRDPQRQIELREQNCGTSHYAVYEMPSSQCSPPTARPGTSNHERGLAIDFSCNGVLIRSRSTTCFRWLADNAARYGLQNLPSEPWHWSIDGT